MEHGLIVGRVLEADAKRLLLADGSEISAHDGFRLPELLAGMTVMVSYTITDGRKLAVALTIVPERRGY